MSYDFSPEQRLLLLNQYIILEELAEDSDYWSRLADAVQFGYELEYDGAHGPSVSEGTLSSEDCLEVREIVDMFMLMQAHFERLDDKGRAGLSEDDLAFRGFSQGQETKLWSYARYLIEDVEGQFDDVGIGPMGYNSGARMLERYRPMVAEWKERAKGPENITGEDLLAVLEAGELAPTE